VCNCGVGGGCGWLVFGTPRSSEGSRTFTLAVAPVTLHAAGPDVTTAEVLAPSPSSLALRCWLAFPEGRNGQALPPSLHAPLRLWAPTLSHQALKAAPHRVRSASLLASPRRRPASMRDMGRATHTFPPPLLASILESPVWQKYFLVRPSRVPALQ